MDVMPMPPTHLTAPVHEWAEIALWQPPQGMSVQATHQSQFVSFLADAYEMFAARKGEMAQTAISTSSKKIGATQAKSGRAPMPVVSGIDAIAGERVKILAAKYATNSADKEVLARLEILNQRLSQRMPTVTVGQVEFLEKINDSLAELKLKSQFRAQRLGLPEKL